jgi:hypothetical protein
MVLRAPGALIFHRTRFRFFRSELVGLMSCVEGKKKSRFGFIGSVTMMTGLKEEYGAGAQVRYR